MKKTLLFYNNANDRLPHLGWSMLLLALTVLLAAPKALANTDEPPMAARSLFTIDGGTITGGPFEFCVGDGIADNVSGVELECNNTENSQWVVTDESGKILGLPPNPEAVNFDGAGAGVCLIWHLGYADGLEGLDAGNNVSDLVGEYDFSNSIKVYRNQPEAGTLVGGPYEFTVDGSPDMIDEISLTGSRSGSNSTFVITDDQGKILGLPPSLEAVKGVDFDGAGAGTCLIWHLRYEDGLVGAEMGLNANDLQGCYDLSNYLEVVRSEPQTQEVTVKVFPNPVTDIVKVSLPAFESREVQVSLFDVTGNAIKNRMSPVVEKSISLEVRTVPAGIYLLRVSQADGKSVTKKVIIR